jgi:hypothetical protein
MVPFSEFFESRLALAISFMASRVEGALARKFVASMFFGGDWRRSRRGDDD